MLHWIISAENIENVTKKILLGRYSFGNTLRQHRAPETTRIHSTQRFELFIFQAVNV